MGRIFNVTADCKPGLHYMVDISPRLARMKEYVDRGEYCGTHCGKLASSYQKRL